MKAFVAMLLIVSTTVAAGDVAAPELAQNVNVAEYDCLTAKLTPQQFTKILERAEKNDPAALDMAFFAYLHGLGCEKDYIQLRKFQKRAYQAGGPLGLLFQGRNLSGYWINPELFDLDASKALLEKAAAYFKPQAEKGLAFCQYAYALSLFCMRNTDGATPWFAKASEHGCSPATHAYAAGLLEGNATDAAKGLALMKALAAEGYLAANVELAAYYKRRDLDESLKWLKAAADKGDPLACQNYSWYLLWGSDNVKNIDEGIKMRVKALDKGWGESSCIELVFREGKLVPQDLPRAFKYIKQGADLGFPKAEYSLSLSYANGTGTAVDKQKAFEWMQRSAVAGYGLAFYGIGNMLMVGDGCAADKQKGFQWIKRAADLNCFEAIYAMGVAYERGDGCAVDLAKAKEWYQQAAQKGYEPAAQRLKVLETQTEKPPQQPQKGDF